MKKIRIDKLLFEKGLIRSREKAQSLIMAGCVLVNEVPVTKSGQFVNEEAVIRITGQDHPYVGRGGVKLAHALKEFKIDVKDRVCVDVGASTGGFTDCLLQNGAAKVYAIDVGYNQLDWKLRNDPRVVVMEKTNIRKVEQVGRLNKLGVAVIDVSFVSLEKVLPHVDRLLQNDGDIIALIKPQFEAGKGKVGKGGIVRDEKVREECVNKVMEAADGLKWVKNGLTRSPITGADGNVEFLAWWVKR
ncbi:MAG: TlyA family rRNA (cytidine-2'-O)-methyltransferase [Deltaproteobacteria bacterium CG11_big_fil_rev_8_21_14_0_20_49_13]|nr:MAG: TlyA family rRNA (cytidine-2'-O)-methyltransferase [Deltaproteobacteria bacterium CG11_big_fil_rev_8_21_14_0_20_49_13]